MRKIPAFLVLSLCTSLAQETLPPSAEMTLPAPENWPAEPPSNILLPNAAAPAANASLSARLRVAVPQPIVSLNGVPRPDIGQSLADEISAALLEGGHCEVVDMEFPRTGQADVTAGSATNQPAPPPDIALVTTVIGDGGGYKLTMKKLRLRDSVVEKITRDQVSNGPLSVIDRMAEQAARQLIPAPPEPAPPKQKLVIEGFYQPRGATPLPLPEPQETAEAAPPALKASAMSPARLAAMQAAKAEARRRDAATGEPRRAGRVTDIAPDGSFCVITPGKDIPMQVGDRFSTWSDRDPANVVDLTVTGVEGSKVIATPPAGREGSLQKGDYVYLWQ